jgi:hypothetical protein
MRLIGALLLYLYRYTCLKYNFLCDKFYKQNITEFDGYTDKYEIILPRSILV